MIIQTSIVDLVAGYRTYVAADELNVHAAVEAPATSPSCAATAAISASAAVSAAGGATYHLGC